MFGVKTEIEKRHTLKHKAVLLLVAVSLVYVLGFLDLNSYAVTLNNEIKENVGFVGESEGNEIVSRAQLYFQLSQQYVPQSEVDSQSDIEHSISDNKQFKWAKEKFAAMGDKLNLLLYQCLFRLSLMQYWSLTLLPIVFAMFYEGYKTREIKMYEFGMTSGKRQMIWLKLMAFFVFMMNLYLILRYSSNFGPYYPPIVVLLSAYTLKKTISHVSKSV